MPSTTRDDRFEDARVRRSAGSVENAFARSSGVIRRATMMRSIGRSLANDALAADGRLRRGRRAVEL
jgi:hypothetical protein